MATQFQDDIQFAGTATFVGKVAFPNQTIGDAQINPSNPITAPKMEHRFQPKLAQPFGVAAAAERRAVHRAKSPGTLTALWVGLTVANAGAATVTVDLFKNGTTVLATPVVLTSATAAFVAVSAAVASAAYTTGDVFEANVTVAAGGGTLGQGVFVLPTFTEAA